MTPAELKTLLSYDPETGELTWRVRGVPRIDNRLAGKPALIGTSDGYRVGKIMTQNLKAHRVAWAIYYGEWPKAMLDHINGNRADNRIVNLRTVSPVQNSQNQRPHKSNTSGEQCVNWFPRDQKWWVKITVARKQRHVGYFDTVAEAVAARDAAYREYGFHENHGNAALITETDNG